MSPATRWLILSSPSISTETLAVLAFVLLAGAGWLGSPVMAAGRIDPQAIFDAPLKQSALSQTSRLQPAVANSDGLTEDRGFVPAALASHLTLLSSPAGSYKLYDWALSNRTLDSLEVVQAEVTNGLDARTIGDLSPQLGFRPMSGQFWKQRTADLGQTIRQGWQLPVLSRWWAERKIADRDATSVAAVTLESAELAPAPHEEEAWLSLPSLFSVSASRGSRHVVRSVTNLSLAPGQTLTFRVAVPPQTQPQVRLLVRGKDSKSVYAVQ